MYRMEKLSVAGLNLKWPAERATTGRAASIVGLRRAVGLCFLILGAFFSEIFPFGTHIALGILITRISWNRELLLK